ncbi:hypothetical protein [Helicobacter canis]|uniref:hypothetical protein n=1 Tax=Helicobacter canis TaxID=29419 RepID=UPI0011C0718E|nr:hypothetical protein [Helicobacter canis]
MDSALRDKSPILRRGLAHYRLGKSLRPHLESGDFSSQILESCALALAFLKITQSNHSPTAMLRIFLKGKQLFLVIASGVSRVAIYKQKP